MRDFLIGVIIAALSIQAPAQMLQSISGDVPHRNSNIVKVQSQAFKQAGATGAYTSSAFTSTGTGNLLTITEFDYAANPSAASLPTSTNNTWVSACTFNNPGRVTVFYAKNSVAGDTTVTVTPNTGASSAVFDEWSGVDTTSPFIGCVGAKTEVATATYFASNPTTSTVNTLAIGASYDRQSASRTYTSDDTWSAALMSPQTTDGDEGARQYILNGLGSQYSGRGTISVASTSENMTALFKSAVSGSNPSGTQPSVYNDFENSTNGTTVTSAILDASTHGTKCLWSAQSTFTQFTVATAAQAPLHGAVTVNGTTYTDSGGTRGIKYDHSNATSSYLQCLLPGSYSSFSVSALITFHAIGATDFLSFLTINDSGTDFVDAQMINGNQICLESVTGTTGSCVSSISMDTEYFVIINYIAAGTHSMKVYSCGSSTCSAGATWSQVGTTQTRAATGNANITSYNFGNSHATTSHAASSYALFDQLQADATGGLWVP